MAGEIFRRISQRRQLQPGISVEAPVGALRTAATQFLSGKLFHTEPNRLWADRLFHSPRSAGMTGVGDAGEHAVARAFVEGLFERQHLAAHPFKLRAAFAHLKYEGLHLF